MTSGMLDASSGHEGSVQLQLKGGSARPPRGVLADLPIVVRDGSAARRRFEAAFDQVRASSPRLFATPKSCRSTRSSH